MMASSVLRNKSQCKELRAELYELQRYEHGDGKVIEIEHKWLSAFHEVVLQVMSFFDELETVQVILDRADRCCDLKKKVDHRKPLLKAILKMVEAARCKLRVLAVINGYRWDVERRRDELDEKMEEMVIVHTAVQRNIAWRWETRRAASPRINWDKVQIMLMDNNCLPSQTITPSFFREWLRKSRNVLPIQKFELQYVPFPLQFHHHFLDPLPCFLLPWMMIRLVTIYSVTPLYRKPFEVPYCDPHFYGCQVWKSAPFQNRYATTRELIESIDHEVESPKYGLRKRSS